MRKIVSVAVPLGVLAVAAANASPESFNVLLKDDGHTWCAYKSLGEFNADAAALRPTDSVRVTYNGDALIEVTYQIEAESGDWVVVDRYTTSEGDVFLKRASLMSQENLQVIQEAVIHGGEVGAFQLVSARTLGGKSASVSGVDLPAVPVKTDLLKQPFVQVVAALRSRALAKLCK